MDKIHLNFSELSKQTKTELWGHIKNNYLVNHNFNSDKLEELRKDVRELFDRNNAGIDIDVFNYMK